MHDKAMIKGMVHGLAGLTLCVSALADVSTPNATVRTLLDIESQKAIAEEQASLAKLQEAANKAKEAAKPPRRETAPVVIERPRDLRVEAITGVTGSRRVTLVDGRGPSFELVEGGPDAYGLHLRGVDRACAFLDAIAKAAPAQTLGANATKGKSGSAKAAPATPGAQPPKLIKVCYTDTPTQNAYSDPQVNRPPMIPVPIPQMIGSAMPSPLLQTPPRPQQFQTR